MQSEAINCPSHGNVVVCSGRDGAEELTGLCSHGGETVTMMAQPHTANPLRALKLVPPLAQEIDLIALEGYDIAKFGTLAELAERVAALEKPSSIVVPEPTAPLEEFPGE